MDKAQLEDLLEKSVRSDATALYLVAGHKPCMRMLDELISAEADICNSESLKDLGREFLFADHWQKLESGEDVEFHYTSMAGVRFRAVVMQQVEGMTMVFHRMPIEVPTIESLGLPESVSHFSEFDRGLVLLTGYPGAGKRSTMAALVEHMNEHSVRHVVSIESPIEFVHPHKQSLVHQREVGFHVNSFASGIQEAVLQGTDVVVVGDVADSATLLAVCEAVEKGVLVFACLHASSMTSAFSELLALCPADERDRMRARLAPVLRAMTSQTLLNRADGTGQVPLVEILVNNTAVSEMVCAGEFQSLPRVMAESRGFGMQTGDAALRDLLSRGLINEDEVIYHAVDRDWVLARSNSPVPA